LAYTTLDRLYAVFFYILKIMHALFRQLCAHYAHLSLLCGIHNWHWTMKRTFKINSRN